MNAEDLLIEKERERQIFNDFLSHFLKPNSNEFYSVVSFLKKSKSFNGDNIQENLNNIISESFPSLKELSEDLKVKSKIDEIFSNVIFYLPILSSIQEIYQSVNDEQFLVDNLEKIEKNLNLFPEVFKKSKETRDIVDSLELQNYKVSKETREELESYSAGFLMVGVFSLFMNKENLSERQQDFKNFLEKSDVLSETDFKTLFSVTEAFVKNTKKEEEIKFENFNLKDLVSNVLEKYFYNESAGINIRLTAALNVKTGEKAEFESKRIELAFNQVETTLKEKIQYWKEEKERQAEFDRKRQQEEIKRENERQENFRLETKKREQQEAERKRITLLAPILESQKRIDEIVRKNAEKEIKGVMENGEKLVISKVLNKEEVVEHFLEARAAETKMTPEERTESIRQRVFLLRKAELQKSKGEEIPLNPNKAETQEEKKEIKDSAKNKRGKKK